ERVGQRPDHLGELVRGADAAAARDDDLRLAEVDALGLRLLDADEARAELVLREGHLERGHLPLGGPREGRVCPRLDRRDDGARGGRDRGVELAVEDAAVEDEAPALGVDPEAVAHEGRVEARGDAGCHVPAGWRVRDQHQVGPGGRDRRADRGGEGGAVVLAQELVVGGEDLAAAALGELLGLAGDALARDQALHRPARGGADLLGEARELVARLADLSVRNLGDDEDARHQRSPSSLILLTSEETTWSVLPWRISARSPFGGGATFVTFSLAAAAPTLPASPRSAAVFTSSGFFFAAMIPWTYA